MSNTHCTHCGRRHWKQINEINRANKGGFRLFCDKKCFGLDRRKHKTKAQKVAEKRLYDMSYRKKNIASIREKKKAYFKKTYDPVKAAIERKANMARHVEYCRRPEYKAWKRKYDKELSKNNPRRRFRLPAFAPDDLVKTFELFRAFRQEQKSEYK